MSLPCRDINENSNASKTRSHQEYEVEGDEDLVQDLVLSSDEEDDDDADDEPEADFASEDEDDGSYQPSAEPLNKRRKMNGSSTQSNVREKSTKNTARRRRPRPKKARKGAKGK